MTLMTNRQTGRTQRMLEASVAEARRGEYVIVLANDQNHVGLLYDRLMDFDGAEPTNRENGKVYFPGGGSVSAVSRHEPNVDMRLGRNIGVHPSVILHADHYAVSEWIAERIGTWAPMELARWEASADGTTKDPS